jgi:hypothetical protein
MPCISAIYSRIMATLHNMCTYKSFKIRPSNFVLPTNVLSKVTRPLRSHYNIPPGAWGDVVVKALHY